MQLSISKSLAKLLTVAVSLPALAGTISVSAQSDYYGSAREPIVSIYEDCDFRGERRDIAVSEFRRMSELDFGNDEMSSIRVPRELEVIIYEHDNFKGDYARVGRDVSCFDNTWNDEVSSLKVQYRERRNDDRVNRGQGQVYGGQRNNRYGSDMRGSDRRDQSSEPNVPSAPSTRFANSCIAYNAFTNGKAGGIRFSTGKGFHRFQERGYKGRICHRGEVTVELNKRDFDTDLTFEVDGRVFKFAAGEKETQFRANWYRKVIKLQVGY